MSDLETEAPQFGAWINLTEIPADQLTDWYRELLRRGWVWLAVEEAVSP